MKRLKKYILIILTGLLLCSNHAQALTEEEVYLAATLFGEAGGEGVEGIQIVASVIMNRRKYYQAHAKGDQTIKLSDVCLAKYQFSFWNDKKDWSISAIESWINRRSKGGNKQAWENCLKIAQQAIAGTLQDTAGGATAYYATWMDKKGMTPKWARNTNFKIVGHHKVVYGVGLSPLKRWNDKTSIAGGGGGNSGSGGGGNSPINEGTFNADVTYTMPPECDSAKLSESNNGMIVNNEIMKHRLFAEDILIDLKDMMALIYRSLSVLFARGHALMCFSTKVSPLCLDAVSSVAGFLKSIVSCTVVIPLLNYLVSGLLIYITGFFMCMSIGMYFIDISFKLGFATLLLPISISLWPFPPTQSKLSENVAIIIYNAMLFAFVSIGTAYAVKLIDASMVSDTEFWKVMSVTSSGWGDGLANVGKMWHTLDSDEYKNSMEKFSEAYDLSSVNLLVILFSLIFGFKILASSIQDYLQFFFGDGALGTADTAMHHMGTQAIGKAKSTFVNPVARVGRDIAMNQGGKAIAGLGAKMSKAAPNTKFGNSTQIPGKTAPITQTQTQTQTQQQSANSVQTTTQTQTQTQQQSAQGANPTQTQAQAQTQTQTQQQGANNQTANQQTQPQNIWQKINNFSRPTGHSLTVGNAFKAVAHPQQTYRTIKKLAQQGVQDWQQTPTAKDKGKLILKKSGQVVLRSVRGNATEAVSGGMSFTGGLMQKLGKGMQSKPQKWYDARKNKKSSGYNNAEYEQQMQKEYEEEQERINNSE